MIDRYVYLGDPWDILQHAQDSPYDAASITLTAKIEKETTMPHIDSEDARVLCRFLRDGAPMLDDDDMAALRRLCRKLDDWFKDGSADSASAIHSWACFRKPDEKGGTAPRGNKE